MKKILVFLLLVFTTQLCYAKGIGTTTFQILQLPQSAYDASLANTTGAGEVSAISNPSIIPFLKTSIVFTHVVYIEDAKYSVGNINVMLNKNSGLNFGFCYFDYGTMDKFLEYGDTVLAGAYNKNRGFQFATWWQTEGGAYLAYGHYTDSFTKAKEDFALRAKLVDGNKVFTQDQAELIFKSVNYARDECEHITYEQDQEMDGIMERLVHGYPEKDFSVMNTHFEPSDGMVQE